MFTIKISQKAVDKAQTESKKGAVTLSNYMNIAINDIKSIPSSIEHSKSHSFDRKSSISLFFKIDETNEKFLNENFDLQFERDRYIDYVVEMFNVKNR